VGTANQAIPKIEDLATELWVLAQLLPGEGIEDGIGRLTEHLLKTGLVGLQDDCGDPKKEGLIR